MSFLIIGCNENSKQKKLERKGEPDVLYVESADDEMNLAIEKAKETFPVFQKAFENKNTNYSDFYIKQRFDTPNGNGEHIWIGDIQMKNGRYFGTVQNVPVEVKDIKLGDSIEISLDRLSDWSYRDKNIVKGGYTIKVLRNHMTDEEKKEMDSEGLIYE